MSYKGTGGKGKLTESHAEANKRLVLAGENWRLKMLSNGALFIAC
jgi:hypothetical protein